MFQFNFQTSNSSSERNNDSFSTQESEVFPNLAVAEEVDSQMNIEHFKYKRIRIEEVHFFVRDFQEENTELVESSFALTYQSCDVVPSVYEGGLKIWECTYDLLRHMINTGIMFEGKNVLDLGCGSGLLGIYAAQQGARTVHFHDYNSEVLRDFTIPNVLKNLIKSDKKFISGDWNYFSKFSTDIVYDYILTSETLYSTDNYSKLCKIFTEKLKNYGEILIASKSYYFGVGGSTTLFKEYLDKENKFQWNVIWKLTEGVQREILCVKKK